MFSHILLINKLFFIFISENENNLRKLKNKFKSYKNFQFFFSFFFFSEILFSHNMLIFKMCCCGKNNNNNNKRKISIIDENVDLLASPLFQNNNLKTSNLEIKVSKKIFF